MKKKIMLGILLVVLLAGVGFGGYYLGTKKTNKCDVEDPNKVHEENKPVEDTKKYSVVISNERDLIYEVDDNYQVLWTYNIKDSTNVYNITRVDGEYIYYVDGDILHRRNYNTGDIENLEIELKDYWNFHVDGNNVVYNVLFDLYHVDLTTKKETKLTITTDNQDALINGIIYFTNKVDGTLSTYNLETKEIVKLEDSGRIEEYNKDGILYVNGNDEYIYYNVKNSTKQKILKQEHAHSSGLNYPIHIYNNKVYTMEKDVLTIVGETKEEVYKRVLKDNEQVTDFIFISNNKILLSMFVMDDESTCEADICEPEGDYKYYLVDLKTKEEKEITEHVDVFDVSYEVYNIVK